MIVEILIFYWCCSRQRKWSRRQNWKRMSVNWSLSRQRRNLSLLLQNRRFVCVSYSFVVFNSFYRLVLETC